MDDSSRLSSFSYPLSFSLLPATYTLGKNQYFRTARKLRILGRALGVAVYIPFVQAYITGIKAALTPRNSTTFVLHLADSSHILEMERRIRTSLAELRQAVRPFLVSPTLWTNTQKVAPFDGVWH
jgi:hypothetical protein